MSRIRPSGQPARDAAPSPGGATLPARGPEVIGYNIRYCSVDMPGAWKYQSFAATGEINITGDVEPGVRYIVEVQCVNDVGRPSDWMRLEHTVVGVDALPPAPTSITITAGADHNKIHVTLPDRVAADVQVRFEWAEDNDGAPGAWTFLDLATGTETKDTYTTGGPRWYRARTQDYQGNFSGWITAPGPSAAKTSEDGAERNTPASVGFKANHSSFSSPNAHEIYVHGFANGVAANVDGKIAYDGNIITVPKGELNTLDDDTTSAGFIVFETNGTSPFTAATGTNPYAFVRRFNGDWFYDNNDQFVALVPSDTMVVIATCEKGPDGVKRVASCPVMGMGSLVRQAADGGSAWDSLSSSPNYDLVTGIVKWGEDATPLDELRPAEGGATSGAPPGTPVGDRDAADINGDAQNLVSGSPSTTVDEISTASGAGTPPWGDGPVREFPGRLERRVLF